VREQLFDTPGGLTYPARAFGFAGTFRQRQRDRTHHFKAVALREMGERYGEGSAPLMPSAATMNPAKRYVSYEGFFGKTESSAKPPRGTGRTYGITTAHAEERIALTFGRVGVSRTGRLTVRLVIGGLQKYLGHTNELAATASVKDLHDIFYLWDAVEDEMVNRSQFLTLIDIYGHYANRGDTVTVATELDGDDPVARGLRFFGNSANCGRDMERDDVRKELCVSEAKLCLMVKELRGMRFDVRTKETHPTMAAGMVLCTYPFPLLSQKAHLERRHQGAVAHEE